MTIVHALKTAALAAAVIAPQFASAQAAAPQLPPALTANVALVSDYRFRGISQSFRQPALQGGFDWAHPSGAYLGNWNSSVSGIQYPNGASLETDFYGGYKFDIATGVTADVGGILYYYPGAYYSGFAPARPRFTNFEVYGGVGVGPFSAKLYVSATDFFGLDRDVGGASSRGSMYLDLGYTTTIATNTTLGLHVGHQKVRNYGDLEYTDYKVSVNYDWQGWILGAALVGTNADRNLYVASDAQGRTKQLGRSGVVLSVARTF